MEVIILAGGLGTRLRSEVKDVPKCMAPIAGKPFLWYLLKDLTKYDNISRVILSVGYLREVIFEWIPTVQNEFPFTFDYAIEEEPLGTGGGIRLAMEKVTEEEAVILNGDTYFAVNLTELVAAHKNQDSAKLTIALKPMKDFDRYGTVSTDAEGRVLKFNEKQPCKEGLINGGVYVLAKDERIFEGLPKKFSFETTVMQEVCGETGCLFGVVQNGYFIDIGIPEDYHKANREFPKIFNNKEKKIIYYSHLFYTDSDFPTIRSLQKKGIDVYYYVTVNCFQLRAGLIDIKKQFPNTGIYSASIYKEFLEYNNYIDLSHVYVINRTHKSKYHPSNVLLYFKLFFHMLKVKAGVLHILNPLMFPESILYKLRLPIVLTLHDPFTHSGRESKKKESARKQSFVKANKIVLLNGSQCEEFEKAYNVSASKIEISKMGQFDYLNFISPIQPQSSVPFILFFGLIAEYKGVEYLLEAMRIVHKTHPNVKLIIAGGGKMYFDIEPYRHLEYVEIINRYIPTNELVGFLNKCLFSVCPYKDATQSGVVQTAFSLGVPVIVTNVGALSDSVTNGKNGLVVPSCDIHALKDAINFLIENPDKLGLMRDNIRNEWQKEMSWDTIADTYIKCYKY